MATEIFETQRFQKKTLNVIEQAKAIIAEYQAQGFKLTLRQLFYQFVARDLLPNTRASYGKVCRHVGNARDAGLIDWDAIEDRTRVLHQQYDDISPADAIKSAARTYKEDLWADQPYHVEVWIEKDALIGVIEDVCDDNRMAYIAQRGSNSLSNMYEAGKRLARIADRGKTPIVLHLTDHDPTGDHMHTDTVQRLAKYAEREIEVRRLGLTMQQVRRYRLPPNTAKEKDPRTPAYIKKFKTDKCWELDALSPDVIANLIRDQLESLIDKKLWAKALRKEENNRDLMQRVSANWSKVKKLVG